MWAKHKQPGFTIVELLIVIVVIGILAAITIVAYNGIQQRARVATVSSDLEGAAKQLAIDQVTSSTYPATVALANNGAGLKASPGTTYQYTVNNSSSPQTFCITATNGTTSYYVSSTNNVPITGACAGLLASYFSNITLTGPPTIQQMEPIIYYDWGVGSPGSGLPADMFSVRWNGYLTAPATGTYTFVVTSDDGERLYVNGVLIVDHWVPQGPTPWASDIALTAGQKVPIIYEMFEYGGGAVAKLEWIIPGGTQTQIPSTAMSMN